MRNLEFGLEASLTQILESIKAVPEKELMLSIPKEAMVLKNPTNLRILEKGAASLGKIVHFSGNVQPPIHTGAPEFVAGKDVLESQPPPTEESASPAVSGHSNFAPTPSPGKKKSGFGFPLPKFRLRGWPLLIIGLLILILAGGAAAYWYLPNAKVILYVTPRSFTKDASVGASLRIGVVDTENNVIPLSEISSTETGNLSAQATGKKTIGEHARGTVTIRNYNTVSSKSFEKGALIKVVSKANEGMKFSLDKAATVPAASRSASIEASGRRVEVTDPGKIDVTVTAVEIGSTGNLAADTQFSVGDQNLLNVDALNAAAFTGGSSEEVTVVTASDRKKLLETLSKQLADKAKGNLKSKLSEGQVILESTIKDKPSKETYSKDIDAQASEVSLTLDLMVTAKAYLEEDLKTVTLKSLDKDVPESYEVDPEKLEVSAEALNDSEEDTLSLIARIDGMLLPKVKQAEVISMLRGQSLTAANEYLKSLENIVEYEIRLWPNLPGPLNTLPQIEGNITIDFILK